MFISGAHLGGKVRGAHPPWILRILRERSPQQQIKRQRGRWKKKKYIVSGFMMAKEPPLPSSSLLATKKLIPFLSFFHNNICIRKYVSITTFSLVLLIQCVPQIGFESANSDSTYIYHLSIPLYCTQHLIQNLFEEHIVGHRKQNAIYF